MDRLKEELAKKRKAIQDVSKGGNSTLGKKYVKRADLEQYQLQQLRKEERQEEEQKSKLSLSKSSTAIAQVVVPAPATASPGVEDKNRDLISIKADDPKVVETEEDMAIDRLVLPRAEVIRRLRILKQPVTLFGEDDDTRLTRLKLVMKTGEFDLDDGEGSHGQQNDFLRDLRSLKSGTKDGKKRKEGAEKEGSKGTVGGDGENGASLRRAEEDDVDAKRLRAKFEDLCEEDKILVYFKKILLEWEQELDSRSDLEKRTQQGRSSLATYRQCARYIDPLFRMCRKKQLYDDIREALTYIVSKCRERNYLAAMDKYIKLAIGNAPWPIGVTMVGIHERSAREKIHTNSVAHIMNDETTRKYLQSVKRLMTLAQRIYPALPSKSVEFNSLANGSDLDSLKKEEAVRIGAGPQLLRLTADDDEDDEDDD